MPAHPGAASELWSAIVFGSRKSRRLSASATTIADRPSGVKYMLYGSSTATAGPGLPVSGSIGVSVPSVRCSALLVTHSVVRSQDGTTCWGFTPTENRSTALRVAGSITVTSLDCRLGTYTRGKALAAAGLSLSAVVSLERLAGAITGGIPDTVSMAVAVPTATTLRPSPSASFVR